MSITINQQKQNKSIIQCDIEGDWGPSEAQDAVRTTQDIIVNDYAVSPHRITFVLQIQKSDTPAVRVLSFLRELLEVGARQLTRVIVVCKDALLASMLYLLREFYEYFQVKLVVTGDPGQLTTLLSDN